MSKMLDDLLPPIVPRYGIHAPLEMRPKYGKFLAEINVDCIIDNPQLLAEMKRQEEESKRFVERVVETIAGHENDAFCKLVEAGVGVERMQGWTEDGSSARGFMVDGVKACTITCEPITKETHFDFVVSTEWHGQWKRLGR